MQNDKTTNHQTNQSSGYLALARKWRPKTFQDFKGQAHVTKALSNALDNNKLHHAYLLVGTRGVGKTTLARIIAKCLNCESGITSKACNTCTTCQEIDAGRFIDLIEVDGASRTRVEETKELLDNAQYAPSKGRFKIYIIDEVHMLSNHSFNALLKTLEEPPSGVKFILATTDPEKIPLTVQSRCLKFNLTPLTENIISEQLSFILTQENKEFNPIAINLIARSAKGSMRDALSLLEQVLAGLLNDDKLEVKLVENILGLEYQSFIPELLTSIINQDPKAALDIINKMAQNSADFNLVTESLLIALHDLAIYQQINQVYNSNLELNLLKDLSNKISKEELQVIYQIALNGNQDLAFAPDFKIGIEMLIIRMISFLPFEAKAVKVNSNVNSEVNSTINSNVSSKVSSNVAFDTTVTKSVLNQKLNWPEVIAKLPLAGLTKMLAKHCVIQSFDGTKLVLGLKQDQAPLLSKERQAQLAKLLSSYFNTQINLSINLQEAMDSLTPQEQETKKAAKELANKQDKIANDPSVKQIIETFGATIEEISVK